MQPREMVSFCALAQLIVMINDIGQAGAGFQSLSESIDTTTAGGFPFFVSSW